MIPCPICGQTRPDILTEDALRSTHTRQLPGHVRSWQKTLEEAVPLARHWNKVRNRAARRVDRYGEEIVRREKLKKEGARGQSKKQRAA